MTMVGWLMRSSTMKALLAWVDGAYKAERLINQKHSMKPRRASCMMGYPETIAHKKGQRRDALPFFNGLRSGLRKLCTLKATRF